jgi:MFS family permease
MVAFIVFAYGMAQASEPWLSATEAAAIINLIGLPASILGNEAAGRIGRLRFIGAVMMASGALAWLAGFTAGWPWWVTTLLLAVYFVCIMGDSAALTAGLVAVAPPNQRGAAMAVHSFMGFGAGFIAPLVFGAVLDVAGGKADVTAWGFAFGSLGAGCLIASFAARLSSLPRRVK